MTVIAANSINPPFTGAGPSNPGNEFEQNNVALWLRFGSALDFEEQEINPNLIRQYLNGLPAPITITEIHSPVRLTFLRTVAGAMYRYVYEFTRGRGKWGGLETDDEAVPVQPQWLELLVYGPASITDIGDAANTVTIPLGELENQDEFLELANDADRDLSAEGNQYYFVYSIGDYEYSKRFKGANGFYGGSYVNQLTDDMFAQGPSTITPPYVIPPWDLTLGVDPVTTKNPVIKDLTTPKKATWGPEGAKFMGANGRTVSLQVEEPTVTNTKAIVPALSEDDFFAMRNWVVALFNSLVKKSGDTMTGDLSIPNNIFQAFRAIIGTTDGGELLVGDSQISKYPGNPFVFYSGIMCNSECYFPRLQVTSVPIIPTDVIRLADMASYNKRQVAPVSANITASVANTTYITNAPTRIVIPVPLNSASIVGDFIEVRGIGAGGWKLSQPEAATVIHASSDTTIGTTGFIQSTNQYNSIRIEKVAANEWLVVNNTGTPDIG
jgi:hypothetical protein